MQAEPVVLTYQVIAFVDDNARRLLDLVEKVHSGQVDGPERETRTSALLDLLSTADTALSTYAPAVELLSAWNQALLYHDEIRGTAARWDAQEIEAGDAAARLIGVRMGEDGNLPPGSTASFAIVSALTAGEIASDDLVIEADRA